MPPFCKMEAFSHPHKTRPKFGRGNKNLFNFNKFEIHMLILEVVKFIDLIMGVSCVTLECHLWSMFALRRVSQTAKTLGIYN
jgi:hypothetical protein